MTLTLAELRAAAAAKHCREFAGHYVIHGDP